MVSEAEREDLRGLTTGEQRTRWDALQVTWFRHHVISDKEKRESAWGYLE
jgi:hypothetical protein